MALKSLQLTDKMNHYSSGQSGHSAQGSMMMNLSEYHVEETIDLINKQIVFKEMTTKLIGNHGSDMPEVTHRIFAEGKGYNVDHAFKTYQASKNINDNNVDFGNSQLLDLLIIKQLDKERNNSQWTDTAYIQGQAHDVLTINANTQEERSLYLNQKSGYLTRMTKKRGQKLRSYDFLGHQQTQGITWAKALFVSTAQQPIYHTNSRKLSFNLALNHQFDIPSGYKQQEKRQFFDVSQLTIRQVAKDVYFVGQEWGYTLFIDAGDYYISAGAWGYEENSQAWNQSLALLRKTTGNSKPVTQHLVSHHHTDHMSGLKSIVEQGANLLIHPTDILAVNKHLQQPLAKERFIPIEKASYLAEGKVMIFDVPTSHASHNLAIYLPEYKLLLTEDIFGSSYQTQFHSPADWPHGDTYNRLDVLINKTNEMGLEVEQYLSTHHGRILNQSEIDEALTIKRPSKESLIKRIFTDRVNMDL